MTKYIIGEIFSSGGAPLYKKPSDQTVGEGVGTFFIQKKYKRPLIMQLKSNMYEDMFFKIFILFHRYME